jgi:putative tryptophan/tyrosine transport system substrate-binding protein
LAGELRYDPVCCKSLKHPVFLSSSMVCGSVVGAGQGATRLSSLDARSSLHRPEALSRRMVGCGRDTPEFYELAAPCSRSVLSCSMALKSIRITVLTYNGCRNVRDGRLMMMKKTKKKGRKKNKKRSAKKQVASKYTIGILHRGAANDPDHQTHIKEFKDALKSAGYAPPLIKFDDDHYPDDDPTGLAKEADKLIKANNGVDVASGGTLALNALMTARTNYGKTTTTPIVFTSVSNPPPANLYLTGVNALTAENDPQRLDLVFELIGRPAVSKIRAIKDPARPDYGTEVQALEDEAAQLENTWNATIDFKIVDLPYSSTIANDISTTFSNFSHDNVQAVVVTADPLYYDNRAPVITAANATNFPTIYQWREFAEAGGLISYGTSLRACYQMAGAYVGLILNDMDHNNGQPANIYPIQSPNTELVINTTTAKNQHIIVPPLLLARAVIVT